MVAVQAGQASALALAAAPPLCDTPPAFPWRPPMTERFVAACIQNSAHAELEPSLEECERLSRAAAAAGARFILLPEYFASLEVVDDLLISRARPEAGHPALQRFQGLARELGAWVLLGSLGIETAPGDAAVVAPTPWGPIGLSICYDLRFPQLYHALAEAGACYLATPAAFVKTTGEAHWHVLQRARAIETGSYVFAPCQAGVHAGGRATYGHSLIVDPWGRVLADGGTEVGFVTAEIDPAAVATARERIPALRHARAFRQPAPLGLQAAGE